MTSSFFAARTTNHAPPIPDDLEEGEASDSDDDAISLTASEPVKCPTQAKSQAGTKHRSPPAAVEVSGHGFRGKPSFHGGFQSENKVLKGRPPTEFADFDEKLRNSNSMERVSEPTRSEPVCAGESTGKSSVQQKLAALEKLKMLKFGGAAAGGTKKLNPFSVSVSEKKLLSAKESKDLLERAHSQKETSDKNFPRKSPTPTGVRTLPGGISDRFLPPKLHGGSRRESPSSERSSSANRRRHERSVERSERRPRSGNSRDRDQQHQRGMLFDDFRTSNHSSRRGPADSPIARMLGLRRRSPPLRQSQKEREYRPAMPLEQVRRLDFGMRDLRGQSKASLEQAFGTLLTLESEIIDLWNQRNERLGLLQETLVREKTDLEMLQDKFATNHRSVGSHIKHDYHLGRASPYQTPPPYQPWHSDQKSQNDNSIYSNTNEEQQNQSFDAAQTPLTSVEQSESRTEIDTQSIIKPGNLGGPQMTSSNEQATRTPERRDVKYEQGSSTTMEEPRSAAVVPTSFSEPATDANVTGTTTEVGAPTTTVGLNLPWPLSALPPPDRFPPPDSLKHLFASNSPSSNSGAQTVPASVVVTTTAPPKSSTESHHLRLASFLATLPRVSVATPAPAASSQSEHSTATATVAGQPPSVAVSSQFGLGGGPMTSSLGSPPRPSVLPPGDMTRPPPSMPLPPIVPHVPPPGFGSPQRVLPPGPPPVPPPGFKMPPMMGPMGGQIPPRHPGPPPGPPPPISSIAGNMPMFPTPPPVAPPRRLMELDSQGPRPPPRFGGPPEPKRMRFGPGIGKQMRFGGFQKGKSHRKIMHNRHRDHRSSGGRSGDEHEISDMVAVIPDDIELRADAKREGIVHVMATEGVDRPDNELVDPDWRNNGENST